MAYETSETSTDEAVYEIEILDGQGRGLTFRATSGGAGAAVYEPLFQAIVAVIDEAPSLALSYARRDYPTRQQVTP
jgi:hypothetical protein